MPSRISRFQIARTAWPLRDPIRASARIDPDAAQNADAGRDIGVCAFHRRSRRQCEKDAAMTICVDNLRKSIWRDGTGTIGPARQSLDPEDFCSLWKRVVRLCGVYQNRIIKGLARKVYGP